MLTESMKELLTAFVDGELSQRQRKAVVRLLHRSSEARELVRQLQENAHKIKQLPRRKVEPSLVDDVLQAIVEQKAVPKQPVPMRQPRRRWQPYVAAGLAASLLIATMGVLYWKSVNELDPIKDGQPSIAKVTPIEIRPDPKPTPDPAPPRKPPNPLLARMVDETFGGFAAPVPVEKIFSASFADLRDTTKGTATGQLTHELNRDRVVQLDITVKSNSVAMDQLRDLLKLRDIKLLTDPTAGKTLKDKNQAKVEYLVYAENFTSDEVTKLMSELGQPIVVSKNGNNQKNVESPYKTVAVAPVAKDEKQKLAKLLGDDVSANEPKDSKSVKPDPQRERSAVLLPTAGANAPSAEIRQFVSQRRPQPGTIQVLIKIRQE